MDNTEKLEARPFKPVPKKSKFAKPNKEGQIPKDCIDFDFTKPHCCYFKDENDINSEIVETDCVVIKGEFCPRYKGTKNVES